MAAHCLTDSTPLPHETLQSTVHCQRTDGHSFHVRIVAVMTKKATSSMAILLQANDRVRVGAVYEAIDWWFATVQSTDGTAVTVQMRSCGDSAVIRTYPLDQVRVVDGKDRDWMLGLAVDIASRKKAHYKGVIVDVKDTITIQYAPSHKEKRAFQATIDHLFERAAQCDIDAMPWNVVEPYSGPTISIGTEVYKKFSGTYKFVDAMASLK